MKSLLLAIVAVLVLLTASYASADTCLYTSSIPAENQNFKINGLFDKKSKKWSYVLTDLKAGKKRTGPLLNMPHHAHLEFYISKDGKHFAVLNGFTEPYNSIG